MKLDLSRVPPMFWREPEGGSGRGYVLYDDLVRELQAQGYVIVDKNKARNPVKHVDTKPEPDAHCITEPDGGCSSTDARCPHNKESK